MITPLISWAAFSVQRSTFKPEIRQMPMDVRSAHTAFDAMIFECARSRRIARDAPDEISRFGIDQDEFLAVMDDVARNRNVQEHWLDVKNPRTLRSHGRTTPAGLRIAVDETSLIVLGPEEIYKDQLNLYDVHRFIRQKIEQIEGTSAWQPLIGDRGSPARTMMTPCSRRSRRGLVAG
ncbi:hypothetical protein C2U70_17385 [Bradyrhizobium guangdongense]|uniref:hypothetical protein n=1 Tax=Bradyrhizobium guangdongense TaxID=1325090 RepID=UPI00112EB3DE|nr:hypothetical protein [Bradyrhizobium guangdongense]TPQ34279.1 hypothetical protein C2U70_17385 [Bradyrhizobium guangdongense]